MIGRYPERPICLPTVYLGGFSLYISLYTFYFMVLESNCSLVIYNISINLMFFCFANFVTTGILHFSGI